MTEREELKPCRMTFNEWFLSLEDGRQAALRDDKWMLAEAAFNAGRKSMEQEG